MTRRDRYFDRLAVGAWPASNCLNSFSVSLSAIYGTLALTWYTQSLRWPRRRTKAPPPSWVPRAVKPGRRTSILNSVRPSRAKAGSCARARLPKRPRSKFRPLHRFRAIPMTVHPDVQRVSGSTVGSRLPHVDHLRSVNYVLGRTSD